MIRRRSTEYFTAMHLTHLGLPVRDDARSLDFYSAYFGFDPASAQRYPDGTVIVSRSAGSPASRP